MDNSNSDITQSSLDSAKLLKKSRSLHEFFVRGEGSLRFWEGIATGTSLVNSFFILTTLTIYQFGLYQLVLAFIGIVGSFNVDQFDGAISIEMRHHFNKKNPHKAKRIYLEYAALKGLIAFILAAVVFFGSGIVASRYGADVGLFIKIISFLLVLDGLQSIGRIFLKSVFSFSFFGASATRELVKLPLLAGFFLFGQLGIAKVLVIHLLGWVGSLALIFFFVTKYWRVIFKKVSASKEFLLWVIIKTYGGWVFFRYVVGKATRSTTPWLIKFFVSTEAVALYSLAVNLVSFVEKLFPINMLSFIFLIKLEDKKSLARIFSRAIKYVFWFGTLAMVVSFVFVPVIINLVLPKYYIAMPLFKWMLLALPIYGIYKVLKWILSTLREYKILALRLITEAIVINGTLILLLPTIGIVGAAFAYIALYIGRIVFFYPALVRAHPYLKLSFKDIFRFDSYDSIFLAKLGRQVSIMVSGFFTKLKITKR